MICKKCKKECLESELKNGICQECITKSKNSLIVPMIISIFISVFLSLLIIGIVNSEVKLSDFKIVSFNMDTEKSTYEYSDDVVSYSGKGKILCKNEQNDYIILIEGTNKINNKKDYIPVIIHNGSGEFSTYDSSYSGTTQKPEYEFKIIGYRSFKK